jgi:hypothetical protein
MFNICRASRDGYVFFFFTLLVPVNGTNRETLYRCQRENGPTTFSTTAATRAWFL